MNETYFTVQLVKGGFILTTGVTSTEKGGGLVHQTESTEVFSTIGKLLKAVRVFTEDHSLVSKKADDESAT